MASHQAREAALSIVGLAGLASRRRRPLSSNVMPYELCAATESER